MALARVIVANQFTGLTSMQVCAVKDATDEEILEFCNAANPSGTSHGWVSVMRKVIRADDDFLGPVPCENDDSRLHFVVMC